MSPNWFARVIGQANVLIDEQLCARAGRYEVFSFPDKLCPTIVKRPKRLSAQLHKQLEPNKKHRSI